MNLLHGQHVFRVAGFNMVLTDEGATAYLENALGTTFPLVIDEVVSKQLFKAHTAELLPAGDYKLVVKSRAGDAGGPLQTSFRKVKYLRVVDPAPTPEPTFTKVCGTGHEDDPAWTGKVARNGKLSIIGTNLTDDLVVSLLYAGEYEAEFDVDEVTPTMIKGTISGGVEPGSSYSFALKKPNGTVIGTAEIECDAD